MLLLADENVPADIVHWLISEGHDVQFAGDLSAGATDLHWLELAEKDERLIITADKDFGELIFRDKINSHGIILIRLFDMPLQDRLQRVKEAWSIVEANPVGKFIVVTSRRVRVRVIH